MSVSGTPDTTTVETVSFVAETGETVGIVGPTGAGKTTLVELLLRFYDVDKGAIRVDGHDIRTVTLDSLRSRIGYVSQEPFLFSGTVYDNIAYGDPEADDETVRAAAQRAGAASFIRGFDDGYDTQVGERGVSLSGGQRQRIALARALIGDPDILVLDEATSHVDNRTEALIQQELEEIIAERTTFVVAHRLSTIRSADSIFVLDDGELIEHGNHDQLLDAEGLYADLWRVQTGRLEVVSKQFFEQEP